MNEKTAERTKLHNTVILVETVACLGAVVESLSQGWEFWVPPLILGGLIASWWMHVTQYRQPLYRENFYIVFSMLVMLFHGVHRTSFFDVFVIYAIVLGSIALLRRPGFIRLLLAEFFLLMTVQILWDVKEGGAVFSDTLGVSRVILHLAAAVVLYVLLMEAVNYAKKSDEEIRQRDLEMEKDSMEREDFLVNLSHELRTPVNVINGLSTLILKKEEREDVVSIRRAGQRLSLQIEDIQDYSEIQRGNVLLEEERYMITSVVNDVLAGYRGMVEKKSLEFIIDLDPDVPAMMRGDVKKFYKIIRHLMENAVKFTRSGGVLLRIKAIPRGYGVNLVIEVTDTGVGMTKKDIEGISRGLYQADRKRDRSNGGVGLGLSVVYGFVRKMDGFVMIESEPNKGTTVRVSVSQEVIDPSPCLSVETDRFLSVVFFTDPTRYRVREVGEFYRTMANHMASGLRVNLYFASKLPELEKLIKKENITHIFMGEEEYEKHEERFNELSRSRVEVAVSAKQGYRVKGDSRVIVLPKPIYGFPVAMVLNGSKDAEKLVPGVPTKRPVLKGVRALVVDDEPMNLVVAAGLFRDYQMETDTAESGREAIEKYLKKDYDLVFMDHMMPEMDGVEAMRQLRKAADQSGRKLRIIALTANAISGAREMFLREGFDGFISKPIHIPDFEKTVAVVLPQSVREGGRP